MATTTVSNQTQELNEDRLIRFHHSFADYGHIIVSRFRDNRTREIIGHIYTEVDGDELRYISTGRTGKELFSPTTDFNEVEVKFERYARLLALHQKAQEHVERLNKNNYSQSKNLTTMKTTTKNPEQPKTKFNQLIFTEYEKATKDGHFITVGDSYHNTIGRIYKNFNEETKKFEYTSLDHAGNPLGKSEKLWELKKEFTNNRELLLEQAHQRRIESKAQAKQTTNQPQPAKTEKQPEAKPQEKTTEKVNTPAVGNKSRQEEREHELEDLRGERENDDRGDMDMDR